MIRGFGDELLVQNSPSWEGAFLDVSGGQRVGLNYTATTPPGVHPLEQKIGKSWRRKVFSEEKQSQHPQGTDNRDQKMLEEGAASKIPHIGCAKLLGPESPLEAF